MYKMDTGYYTVIYLNIFSIANVLYILIDIAFVINHF